MTPPSVCQARMQTCTRSWDLCCFESQFLFSLERTWGLFFSLRWSRASSGCRQRGCKFACELGEKWGAGRGGVRSDTGVGSMSFGRGRSKGENGASDSSCEHRKWEEASLGYRGMALVSWECAAECGCLGCALHSFRGPCSRDSSGKSSVCWVLPCVPSQTWQEPVALSTECRQPVFLFNLHRFSRWV